MSATETSGETDADGSAVARNYAFVLLGGVIFPFMVAAHLIARKRRNQPEGLEQSHYAFQHRTTSLALLGFLAVGLVGVAMIAEMPSLTQVQRTMRFTALSNASWLIMLWIAVRGIRGLYLSAARRAIRDPKTLWIWPR